MRNKDISGSVAFGKGKIIGYVKIISNEKDIEKVQDGDILIITVPSAEFVGKLKSSGTLKKASALITEVGGLLSHISIIAREMKKPCIIGARNILKTIKDGDLIEVDANKGIIKILERSK